MRKKEKPSQPPFLSLFWKGFIFLSMLIVGMSASLAVINYFYLDYQFKQQRELEGASLNRQLNDLFGRSVSRLQQMGFVLAAVGDFSKALKERNAQRLKSAADLFGNFQYGLDIEQIDLFTVEGRHFWHWGIEPRLGPAPQEEAMVQAVKEQEKPLKRLSCDPECALYVYQPVLAGGEVVGVFGLRQSVAQLVIEFRSVAGSDLGILIRDTSPGVAGIPDWGMRIAALTDAKKMAPLLRSMASSHPQEAGVETESVFPWQGHYYSVRRLPLRDVLNLEGGAVIVTDVTARVEYIQQAAAAGLFIAVGTLLGAELLLFLLMRFPLKKLRRLTAALPMLAEESYAQARQLLDATGRRPRFNDEVKILESTAVKLSHQLEAQALAMARDFAEIKAAEAKIHFMAHYDRLTELPNRLLAMDRFKQAMAYASRGEVKVALLYLDLDKFKNINDSLGHAVGDALLKEVAQRLWSCIRASDTVSRQGGDEFLVVLPEIQDPQSISIVTAKILRQLSTPFSIDGHDLSISVSIGVTVYPDDGEDFDTLLKKADIAMYHAKDAGGNVCRFFDQQMNIDAVERINLHNSLQMALGRGEFVLHYQPKIDLASGVVTGAEALIRWNHPQYGLTSPGRFIHIAEDSGLIVLIGEWVLREVCRQVVAWQRAGLPKIVVAANLSAVQFKRGNLEQTVAGALEAAGLEPRYLELELTESIMIGDTELVLQTVDRLKALGLKLSIDDFGTGYSCLAYLKRFAVDKVKIDQSFVRGMIFDASDMAIVQAIIQMARSMGLKTVAEGIEEVQVLDCLRSNHCDEGQGYFIARPMPAEEFAAYLAKSGPPV
jgi:diguanylate cyclase (GGDEF)-like protein